MSVLKPGEEPLHYSDGAHRWMCPEPDGNQDAWLEQVREHIARHASGEGSTPSSLMPPMRRSTDDTRG
jgi:hypothetical protein